MGLFSIRELHTGRSGSDATGDKGAIATYSRSFRVIMTSQFDTISEVAAAMPNLGSVYPDDPFATCIRRRVNSHDKAKRMWLTSADYSTKGKLENPFDDPAIIEWNTSTTVEPFYKDNAGDAILNSAGDYYEEGLKDDVSRWTVSITTNQPGIPLFIDDYRDAINEDDVLIDGLLVPLETAKVSGIRIGRVEDRNGIFYRVFTLGIKIKDSWLREVLDQGMHRKDPNDATKRIRCVNDDGTFATKLKLLDGAGAQLANPTPATAEFNTHDIRNLQPFSVLPLN